MGGAGLLGVAETEAVDDIALWIPTYANMFVPIGRNNVFFVGCQEDRSDDRSMAKDELTSGWIVVRSNGLSFAGVRR